MLAEAVHLARHFGARLVLIHVGPRGPKEEQIMQQWVDKTGLPSSSIDVQWDEGNPAKAILKICRNKGVDLLLAGALKRENLLQFYLGSIARQIMRKASCSVLLLTRPSTEPAGFRNIVVNAEDSPFVRESISAAFAVGQQAGKGWVHIVRELKMYGLAMSASDQCSETEYEEIRNGLVRDEIEKVELLISDLPHKDLKVNIKVISGKSGFELAQFARKKEADLLVVGAPSRGFKLFDRIFTHDLEYVFADLPCNLLIVNPGKEEAHE